MGSVERPGSFVADVMGDWEDWVLEHGMPQRLPETLGVGEIVPVACWRDESWAAVLHLVYREAEVDPENPAFDREAGVDDETQTFRRDGDGWEAAGGSGGGSWFDGLRLRPPDIGDDEAIVLGTGAHGEAGWLCGTARGVAGRGARTVEVEQGGRVIARPIDSPVGAWVTAFDGTQPAVVRVRSAKGVLVERVIEPVRYRFAPGMHGPVASTHGAIELWGWPDPASVEEIRRSEAALADGDVATADDLRAAYLSGDSPPPGARRGFRDRKWGRWPANG